MRVYLRDVFPATGSRHLAQSVGESEAGKT
jgi:hypothetical protein